MKPMTPKQQHWQDILDTQAESGIAPKVFCEQEGIPLQKFYHWKSYLKKRSEVKESAQSLKIPAFQAVRIEEQAFSPCSSGVEVSIKDMKIQYHSGVPDEEMIHLLRLLRSA
jgi:hypothetical protein